MSLIILASLILLSLFTAAMAKKQNTKKQQAEKDFWEREREANSVRRKPLDNLDYILIPMEKLPTKVLSEDPMVAECLDVLSHLSVQPVVNLTGYTNTDLKLEYGTANITELSEYDQNYTLLARTLQRWADILLENGFEDEAQIVMEYAVSTHTDISRTYYKLAEIYSSRIETEKVAGLIEEAEALNSSYKDTIARTLRETYL